jgi:hypothetical protein
MRWSLRAAITRVAELANRYRAGLRLAFESSHRFCRRRNQRDDEIDVIAGIRKPRHRGSFPQHLQEFRASRAFGGSAIPDDGRRRVVRASLNG